MTNQQRRLYRSRTNKVLAGVCGGLSEYLNVDAKVVRLVWILLTLLGGSGIIAYILAYFIVPVRPVETDSTIQPTRSDFTTARILGVVFVVIGLAVLLDNLEIFSFHYWWHMSWEFVLPGILILIGIYFLTKREKIPPLPTTQASPIEAKQQSHDQIPLPGSSAEETKRPKVFRRSLTDKKLLGICGGAGEYFDIDPTIVRIGYTVLTILSGGVGIILYFLMYLIVPEGQPQPNKQ